MKIFNRIYHNSIIFEKNTIDFQAKILYTVGGKQFTEVTYMEQKNKSNVWKIVLISLAAAAVVAAGVVILVKVIKKKKAAKQLILEWDDEEAFEKCMNGHGDCEIVVISEQE